MPKTAQPLPRTNWRERPKAAKTAERSITITGVTAAQIVSRYRPGTKNRTKPARKPNTRRKVGADQRHQNRDREIDQFTERGLTATPKVADHADSDPLVESRNHQADYHRNREKESFPGGIFNDHGDEEEPKANRQKQACALAIDPEYLVKGLTDSELAVHLRGILALGEDYPAAVASEIERKFLVSTVPDWLGDHPATRIEQGYLAIDAGAEVRLRRAGADLTLTVKRGSGEVREEVEISLGPGQFSGLWPLTEGRRLVKTRHLVPLGDRLRAEVDVYSGALAGLVTAEVEFESRQRSRSFRPRRWMGEELTGDARYSNQSLAAAGAPGHESAADGENQDVDPEPADRTYRLKPDESAAEGLRRAAHGRAEKAAIRLRDADPRIWPTRSTAPAKT